MYYYTVSFPGDRQVEGTLLLCFFYILQLIMYVSYKCQKPFP